MISAKMFMYWELLCICDMAYATLPYFYETEQRFKI